MSHLVQNIPNKLAELDSYIRHRESKYDLKDGTQAKIIWNHKNQPQKTKQSIVYLHGFRASHPEGYPVHRSIAQTLGYNLYLSRMEEHGINTPHPLLNLTEEKMLESARFAIDIGKRLGEKVILMGTSTGASLALYLASQAAYQKHISSLILYSPLIRFYGISNKLLTNSWGRKALRLFLGNKYLITSKNSTYSEDKIWNKSYALAGALSLGSFVEHHMKPSLFKKVTHPTFVGYYYKNKREHDKVVSVKAIKQMTSNLGTRTELLKILNFPNTQTHVISNSLLSKSVDSVIDNTLEFLKMFGSHEYRKK